MVNLRSAAAATRTVRCSAAPTGCAASAHIMAARVGRATQSFFNPLLTRYLLMHVVRLEANDGSVIISAVRRRLTRPISEAQLGIAVTASRQLRPACSQSGH